jgi:hypothetical protein
MMVSRACREVHRRNLGATSPEALRAEPAKKIWLK